MSKEVGRLADYATLQKLAAVLWHEDNSYAGAAVMVGAGFSRSSASKGDARKKLPLWENLSKALLKGIKESSHSEPLRLAEEYCAYFGRQALDDLLRREIEDLAWSPGELHRPFLKLPWAEVLTTNWDTLLERASEDIHYPVYSVVSKAEDFAVAHSPRIVKLHGTIGTTKELIFTQEDYRKYPLSHAVFVNFARQVLIENELCLLGFSGDDPNFLQWIGWVRDQLSTHARRIYLVGALNLRPAQRKYFESINIAPIDLSALVVDCDNEDTQHFEATKIFIEALEKLRPTPAWKWGPKELLTPFEERKKRSTEPAYGARSLEDQLPSLEKERTSYPGWLICPCHQHIDLKYQMSGFWPTPESLSAMSAENRAKLLYEIAWRHSLTYAPISPWLARELRAIADPSKPCCLQRKQQMEIALWLLKNTRWFNDHEFKSIQQEMSSILECGENLKHWPESSNELAYHRAILARDQFDYPAIEKQIEKIETVEPVWKLRKASLLAELGRYEDGKKLIEAAYQKLLQQHRKDRNSIYVLSRLAWAHWLMREIEAWFPGKALEAFPSKYQEVQCNPLDHIQYIQDQISRTLENQRKSKSIEPLFEPGLYRDNSKTIIFDRGLDPLFLWEGVSNAAGVPLRWAIGGFLVDTAAKLTELNAVKCIKGTHLFALAIRAASTYSSDILENVFSRIQVARFSEEDVAFLLERCKKTIGYWKNQLTKGPEEVRRYALDRLRVFMEVLARISVRLTKEKAKEIFQKALSFGKKTEFHHYWLTETLANLMKYALTSIPQSKQSELLLEALSFPLEAEIMKVDKRFQLPNPVIYFPGKRQHPNTELARRIDEIIESIEPCSPQSAPALERLIPLFKNGFLSENECQKLEEKIWGAEPKYKFLPITGLFRCELLRLPVQNCSAVKSLISQHLFSVNEEDVFKDLALLEEMPYSVEARVSLMAWRKRWEEMPHAAKAEDIQVFPSEPQALDYFAKALRYFEGSVSSKINEPDSYLFFGPHLPKQTALVAQALAYSIVPSLPKEALNRDNFNKLISCHEKAEAPALIIALSHFAVSDNCFSESVEKIIRQGLRHHNENEVAYSAQALLKWREQRASPAIEKLISLLIYLLGLKQEGGLHWLLEIARQMYNKEYLSEDDIKHLIESVPSIFDDADYKKISPSSQKAISISSVRAECVKLAREMFKEHKNSELSRILEEAKADPLPEVRFA